MALSPLEFIVVAGLSDVCGNYSNSRPNNPKFVELQTGPLSSLASSPLPEASGHGLEKFWQYDVFVTGHFETLVRNVPMALIPEC